MQHMKIWMLRAEKMAQQVKCLLSKHKNWVQIPSTQVYLGVVVHVLVNPVCEEKQESSQRLTASQGLMAGFLPIGEFWDYWEACGTCKGDRSVSVGERERGRVMGVENDQNSFFTFRKLLKNTNTNDNLKLKWNVIWKGTRHWQNVNCNGGHYREWAWSSKQCGRTRMI